MVEVMKKQKGSRECSVKSFNSVIMKFNKIDESFKKLRSVFQKIDKDFDGKIDLDKLKRGFQELHVSLTDQEIKELYQECDMDESRGIDFKEFIVLLALIYLLEDSFAKSHLLPELEVSFKTIVDTFMFFDKDGDGYVRKNEIVQAINDIGPGQRTSGSDIALKRFEEMDWNKDGAVSLKEFLFAFINWVSVEDGNDDS
ncbi:hypothetical protein SUGI_0503050 [Cryptomeria japonica]|nr:hypothetical protein SUGI_0503050 [Cryptomeria japonica]